VAVIDTPAGPVAVTHGGTVDFTGTGSDADGDALTFSWDFGLGAAPQAVEDPGDVMFTRPGLHTVTFTATDDEGLSGTDQVEVTVSSLAWLTVTAQVVNDDGGSQDPGDFSLFIDGDPVTSGSGANYSVGDHVVSAAASPGYLATIGGDCGPDGGIELTPGGVYQCVVVFDDAPAQLFVTHSVTNDDGGTSSPDDFTLFVDGTPIAGSPVALSTGTHQLTRSIDPGYTVSFGGDCAPDGRVSLGNGDTDTCTVVSDDVAPQLTVTKLVVNDDEGSKEPGDFALFVDGAPITSGAPTELDAGVHVVSETQDPGYIGSFGGDCAADGSIALAPGEVRACTLTNDDVVALLTVTKLVVNDDGGTKQVADFPLFVDGAPVTSGDPMAVDVGDYVVTETADPAYAATFGGDCAADGSVSLALGDVKACTLSNDDIAPRLTVSTVVVNDDGGELSAADFSLFVDGVPITSGVATDLVAGDHTVSESGDPGYAVTIGGDCSVDGSISLAPGDVASCTVTHDDIAPRLTVVKVVVNDDGDSLTADDFQLFVDGDPIDSGAETTLDAGDHVVSEDGDPGYDATFSDACDADGDVALDPGDVVTCFLTNDDNGSPTLHVGDLDAEFKDIGGRWRATFTVRVHDQDHDDVDDVIVSGRFSGAGESGTDSCRTDRNGLCSVTSPSIDDDSGTLVFTIEDLDLGAHLPRLQASHDPNGDSNPPGISISVSD
jgi:hypothetical protein